MAPFFFRTLGHARQLAQPGAGARLLALRAIRPTTRWWCCRSGALVPRRHQQDLADPAGWPLRELREGRADLVGGADVPLRADRDQLAVQPPPALLLAEAPRRRSTWRSRRSTSTSATTRRRPTASRSSRCGGTSRTSRSRRSARRVPAVLGLRQSDARSGARSWASRCTGTSATTSPSGAPASRSRSTCASSAATASRHVALNTYFERKRRPANKSWQFHFFPLLTVGRGERGKERDKWWSMLLRPGRLRKARRAPADARRSGSRSTCGEVTRSAGLPA